MIRLGTPVMTRPLPIVLGAGALVAVAVFRVSAVWVVIAAGLIGVLAAKRE